MTKKQAGRISSACFCHFYRFFTGGEGYLLPLFFLSGHRKFDFCPKMCNNKKN